MRQRSIHALIPLALLLLGVACDRKDSASDSGEPAPDDSGQPDTGTPDSGDSGSCQDDTGDGGPTDYLVGRCSDPIPEGAATPPPLPEYSGDHCPELVTGTNLLSSGGVDREFILVLPEDYDPDSDQLPVLFMWTYLFGSSSSMLEHGQVQESADELRFIGVVPESTGDLEVGWGDWTFDPVWPYMNLHPDSRVEQEVTFFDDILACVAEQYPVQEHCISSVGVSAGALWTAQLAQHRSDRLASVILMSGGVGPATGFSYVDVRGWSGAERAMPALVGWGGPTDWFGVDFEQASLNLEAEYEEDGNFVMECVHDCGHGVPPIDHDLGLSLLYAFALDHPYWTTPGHSVYQDEGMEEGTPEWCAIGVGQATIRDGDCDPEDKIEE